MELSVGELDDIGACAGKKIKEKGLAAGLVLLNAVVRKG